MGSGSASRTTTDKFTSAGWMVCDIDGVGLSGSEIQLCTLQCVAGTTGSKSRSTTSIHRLYLQRADNLDPASHWATKMISASTPACHEARNSNSPAVFRET